MNPLEILESRSNDKSIRSSLTASTVDGIFATIFTNITGGVLLSNFLLQLNASAVEIGLLSSIPMLVNLLQPVGAKIADRTSSRRHYGFWLYGISRILWLILALGILFCCRSISPHQLVILTLGIIIITHILSALGSASWMSWIAAIVPGQLRGRYFGFRNSSISLTSALVVPIAGWIVAKWRGGSIEGYGIVLIIALIAGLISLAFQCAVKDINPREEKHLENTGNNPPGNIFQDSNFLTFLTYFALWMFAVNIGAPFFNLYLLDRLHINVGYVTLYNSIGAVANLILLPFWGKLSDRVGNLSLLLTIGFIVALSPLLWLGLDSGNFYLWIVIPLIHILFGATWAAIDLCTNNLQIEIAPLSRRSDYFAATAAIGGITGALGTTFGSFLANSSNHNGFLLLFILSAALRILSLLPLMFVNENGEVSLWETVRSFFPRPRLINPLPALAVLEARDKIEG